MMLLVCPFRKGHIQFKALMEVTYEADFEFDRNGDVCGSQLDSGYRDVSENRIGLYECKKCGREAVVVDTAIDIPMPVVEAVLNKYSSEFKDILEGISNVEIISKTDEGDFFYHITNNNGSEFWVVEVSDGFVSSSKPASISFLLKNKSAAMREWEEIGEVEEEER